MIATERVIVRAAFDTKERMDLATAAGKSRLAEVSQEPYWAQRFDRDVPGAERAQLRARWAEHVAALRRSGEVLDTQAAVIEWGGRRALAERGWNTVEWPPAPPEARLPGRWPGGGDTGSPQMFTVRLDTQLVARVYAACWWSSAEAISGIRAWRDDHPNRIYDPQEIDNYDRLAVQVTTVGALWRQGLDLVLPPLPPAETAGHTINKSVVTERL